MDMTIMPGDRITACGVTFIVENILHQEYFGRRDHAGASDFWGFDVEFKDNHGAYHHWKQNIDHGYAERMDTICGQNYWNVFGRDGMLKIGDRITIRWDDGEAGGYAETVYTGRDLEGGYIFRSIMYGWNYVLDKFLRVITFDPFPDTHHTWDADGRSGWIQYVP